MTPAIQIRQVHKRFGAVQALAGIDLEVAPGEFFGLLGPNGAGKTTLINILAGLARADSGSVRIMGHDVIADYRESRRALGVVPQELVFDPFFSVRETLHLQSGYFGLRHNDAWIDEVMHHLDLTGKADANMRSLSGGMKRRVLVAQALVHKPPVIVLDEPTAGVDVELRQGLWEFVRGLNRDGHTIVLTTHYLEEAETLCARIAMLKQGRIVALDTTNNLVNRLDNLYLKLRIAGAALPAALAARVRDSHDPVHTLCLRSYAEVEGVLAQVREAGARIEELELLQPDLEDVFVQIMNREERREVGAEALLPSSRLAIPGSPQR
jgi:ABC-2 type transport system ATP-binding protein